MASQTEVKTCPKCRLISPPEAELCDCGYDFMNKAGAPGKWDYFKIGWGALPFVIFIIAIVISSIVMVCGAIFKFEVPPIFSPLFLRDA